jgi:hypothetical protein
MVVGIYEDEKAIFAVWESCAFFRKELNQWNLQCYRLARNQEEFINKNLPTYLWKSFVGRKKKQKIFLHQRQRIEFAI